MSASASDFAVSASANMRPPSQKPDDGEVLARLTTEDLKELGVVAVGGQRKLLTAIADLSCPVDAVAKPTLWEMTAAPISWRAGSLRSWSPTSSDRRRARRGSTRKRCARSSAPVAGPAPRSSNARIDSSRNAPNRRCRQKGWTTPGSHEASGRRREFFGSSTELSSFRSSGGAARDDDDFLPLREAINFRLHVFRGKGFGDFFSAQQMVALHMFGKVLKREAPVGRGS